MYKAAYDEAAEHGLVDAGREVVAEQVLHTYIAARSSAPGAGVSLPQSGEADPEGQSNLTPMPGTSPTPMPGTSPTPMPGTSPTPTPGSPPTPTPGSSPPPTPTPTPEATIAAADVDGYHSNFSVQIFVSSIGVNLSMSRVNTYTANGSTVRLTSGGNLTTGAGGTPLRDRYSWAYNPVNGSIGESRTYASDQFNVGLPKTSLDNAPLLSSSLGQRVSRICAGDEAAPSSTTSTSWGQNNSL